MRFRECAIPDLLLSKRVYATEFDSINDFRSEENPRFFILEQTALGQFSEVVPPDDGTI
jgi:hypothetical protein